MLEVVAVAVVDKVGDRDEDEEDRLAGQWSSIRSLAAKPEPASERSPARPLAVLVLAVSLLVVVAAAAEVVSFGVNQMELL